jgi:deoxyguanosine kinase
MPSLAPAARYVAIEGPPGAGVGPLAERLAARSGGRLVRDPIADNPFLPRFAEDPRRYAFPAQVAFLLARHRQQGELSQEDLFARGGLVADYLLARDLLWATVTLSPEELALYRKIHALLDGRAPRPDLVVYLTARAEVLRARLQRRFRPSDRVVEAGLIDDIAGAMSRYFFSYQDSPLLVVNTSEIDGVEDPARLDEIIAVIARTRAGVQHYNPG